MISRFSVASCAPTKLQVSESAVEPLEWVAFLIPKETGHFLLPQGEEISSQKPPDALVV